MITTVIGFVLAAAVAWFLIRVSVPAALGVVLATTFLVPGTVLVPGATSGYSSIHRLGFVLFILNILRKVARGEIPASVLKPNRITAALGAWVALTFVIGVAMAETTYPVGSAVFLWVFIVEYAVFFYFVTVAARIIGDPWRLARLVSAFVVLASVIAIFEHFSGIGFGRWLAERIRAPRFHSVVGLAERGGDVRVQAGFEFALAYAWAATILLPLVVVVATRARNRLLRLTPALVAVSIAWTYARSAYVGVLAGIALLLLMSRFDRRVLAFAGAGLVAAAAFAFATNAYDTTFSSPEVEGSTLVREERLPIILTSAAEDPHIGKGFGSVAASGIRTTDSLFLLTYAEIGVIGVSGLILLLAATLAWIGPGLRAPPPEHLIGGAAIIGVLLGIASGAFVDGFTVSGLARSFWLIAAVGAFVAERAPARATVVHTRPARRALMPVAGVVAGILILGIAPTSSTTTLRFTTRTPYDDVAGQGLTAFNDRLVLNTVCEIIEARVDALGHDAQCYDLRTSIGAGEVRFEAPTAAAVQRDLLVSATVVRRRLPSVRFYAVGTRPGVRPTWVRTAPYWMGLAGLALALLVPPLPPLRRRASPRGFLSAPTPA